MVIVEQLWNYLAHIWEDKGVKINPKSIRPKVSIIAQDFELTHNYYTVLQANHDSHHHHHPKISWRLILDQRLTRQICGLGFMCNLTCLTAYQLLLVNLRPSFIRKCLIIAILHIQCSLEFFFSPVSWGCRIHTLHLCSGVRPQPPTSEWKWYKTIRWWGSSPEFWKNGVPLHCHCSQLQSRPE